MTCHKNLHVLKYGYPWGSIALAPLLLGQGLYVKRVTPRLPEPDGERSGSAGEGKSLRLLIVGDSAAAGVGVAHQDNALAGQLVKQLSADFQVSWRLVAASGFTSAQIIARLDDTPAERFDFAITSIGVNDVTAGMTASSWLSSQQALMQVLSERFQVGHILYSSLPPMHLFPALPQPLRWYLGSRAQHFNRLIRQHVQGCDDREIILTELEGHTMASDGFHPSASIYAAWAERVAEVIRARHV